MIYSHLVFLKTVMIYVKSFNFDQWSNVGFQVIDQLLVETGISFFVKSN